MTDTMTERYSNYRKRENIMLKESRIAIVAAGTLLVSLSLASAHCDTIDGPVAKAAVKALVSGNVNPALAYAPAEAESEIKSSFDAARKVRSLGNEARALADRSFIETVIRLHRAGEGAPYTGLKAAGEDAGPVIKAAEQAVETGDIDKLKAILGEEIEHALTERFSRVRELSKVSLEPKSPAEVLHTRERVSAELGFITFAERIRQAALGKGAEHHAD